MTSRPLPGLPSHIARFLAVGVVTAWTLLGGVVAPASAEACPDVEVAFARGTGEPAGVGPTGQAFVNSLRSEVGDRSVRVYAVNYPASDDFSTATIGIKDAADHVESVVASCPKTRMVLGGFSQGAAVMGFVTSPAVPDGVDPAGVPRPMQPEVADHVAAVTLFATPNARAMSFLGQPPLVIGPLYEPKTIELCAIGDAVCSDGLDFAAHDGQDGYAHGDGLVDRGATFAASHL